jgi:hypothetical protein
MSNATQTFLSGALERKLRHEQLANQIANRNYEGQITGPEDSVKILVAQNATVSDYTGGQISIETGVDATPRTLTMDHRKAFAFSLDGDTNLQQYADGFAGETFAEVLEFADQRILEEAPNGANDFAFDQSVTSGDVSDLFGEAQETLNDNAVPMAQRYAVVPSSTARLVYEEIKNRDTNLGDEALLTGLIGRYYGFDVYARPSSFFGSNAGDVQAMFGSRFAVTYADAVVALQILNDVPGLPGGIVIQGLHVAGAKVVKPKGVVMAEITE